MALNQFELTIKMFVSVNYDPNVVLHQIKEPWTCSLCFVVMSSEAHLRPSSLERQMKGVMGTRPAAYGFAHPANDGQLVGVGTWWDGRKRWSRGKSGLEGASALATATHLPPADEEGEGRRSRLRRGEASFGENITRQTR